MARHILATALIIAAILGTAASPQGASAAVTRSWSGTFTDLTGDTYIPRTARVWTGSMGKTCIQVGQLTTYQNRRATLRVTLVSAADVQTRLSGTTTFDVAAPRAGGNPVTKCWTGVVKNREYKVHIRNVRYADNSQARYISGNIHLNSQ